LVFDLRGGSGCKLLVAEFDALSAPRGEVELVAGYAAIEAHTQLSAADTPSMLGSAWQAAAKRQALSLELSRANSWPDAEFIALSDYRGALVAAVLAKFAEEGLAGLRLWSAACAGSG
jgi:hypothetical protein